MEGKALLQASRALAGSADRVAAASSTRSDRSFGVLQAAHLGRGEGLTLRTSKEILHSLAHIGFPLTAEQAAPIQVLPRASLQADFVSR